MRVAGLPQTQRLRHAVTITEHRQIPGLAGDDKPGRPVTFFADFAANTDLHIQRLVMTEPRIAAAMPVVRRFHLLAISKRLTEQAVLVIQAVARRGLADRCH
ncbi:hypothetical protein D3C73_1321270 [compost metagenome]